MITKHISYWKHIDIDYCLLKYLFYILYRIGMKKVVTKKLLAKNPLAKKAVEKKSPVVKVLVATPKKSPRIGALAIANLVGFVAVIVVNYLAISLPIWWMSTGELSDLYPNLFTLAGLTFSIWGVIYLLLFAFVLWQLVDFYKKQSTAITKKIGIWFLLSCIANIGWIFAWHNTQLLLSVIIMLAFLVLLIIITKKIELGKRRGSVVDKYLVQVPFSIYLWRISVATIANISALLVSVGWNMWGISDIVWTIAVIIVATILALLSLYKKNNIPFALVVIRAFIGIILKRIAVDPVYASSILWILGGSIVVISAGIGLKFETWKKN